MPTKARLRKSRRGLLFVLSAPSGTGKTTVVKKLLSKEQRLWRSVSATTRARRQGEKHGRDYLFLSKPVFARWIRSRNFLEWARVFNNYYGTPKKPVERFRRQGRDVMLVIDIKGAQKVMQKTDAFSIFLKPPSLSELARRLGGRNTDSPEEQRKRLAIARKEMAVAGSYDAVIVNRDVDQTVLKLRKWIEKVRSNFNIPQRKKE